MGTELARVQNEVGTGIRLQTFEDAWRFADVLAKTSFVPKDMRGNPGDVFAAIQMGAELGIAPLQALQGIAVINGRPSVWGDLMLALIMSDPQCDDVEETFTGTVEAGDMACTCIVSRRGFTPFVNTFSIEDAKRAGLWGKGGPWTQHPKRMLKMRARGFSCRDGFPDKLRGIITREEAMDLPPIEVQVNDGSGNAVLTPAALPNKGNDALKAKLAEGAAAKAEAKAPSKAEQAKIVEEAQAFIASLSSIDELKAADWSMIESLSEADKKKLRTAIKSRGQALEYAAKKAAEERSAAHDPVTGEVDDEPPPGALSTDPKPGDAA